MERKQQLEKSLAATVENGNFCNERSPIKIFFRNCYLWTCQLFPSWKHWLELGQRREGLTAYEWAPGMPFIPANGGGKVFPQVFCKPYGARVATPVFTDDVIFSEEKTGLFQLVVLLANTAQMNGAVEDLAALEEKGQSELKVDEATFLIDDGSHLVDNRDKQASTVENIHTIIRSKKSDSSVWKGLPDPIGYDGSRMRREVKGKYVIVRPDRFIYAVCRSRGELINASNALAAEMLRV